MFAAFFGFGGAFISLAMSKSLAKMSMGVRVIEQPGDSTEQWLVSVVQHHARTVGVGMPEVGIFDSPEPNAFATGASRNSSLVAVSSGLLQSMNRQEIEAVLGHEMTHVANGDMVTLTLVQGVVNTFVIFLSRLIAGVLDRSSDNRGGGIYFLSVIVLQLVFGILANLIVMWFSRRREFRADAGGAKLAGTGIRPHFPLWGLPTATLAQSMVEGGLQARLTCVDPRQLSSGFAGRAFDAALLRELPNGVDPCGERGEFHTFAHAGPMFRRPVPLSAGEVVERDGFVFADFRLTSGAAA